MSQNTGDTHSTHHSVPQSPYTDYLFFQLPAAQAFAAQGMPRMSFPEPSGFVFEDAGTVVLLLYKNFGQADLSWLSFFVNCSYATAIVCGTSFLASMFYFNKKVAEQGQPSA